MAQRYTVVKNLELWTDGWTDRQIDAHMTIALAKG